MSVRRSDGLDLGKVKQAKDKPKLTRTSLKPGATGGAC